jgi:ribosomal protein S18 acetylase RimI-like enzyme
MTRWESALTRWESGRLDATHNLDGFDCGIESLNRWLVQSARRVDADGITRVYVWTAPGSPIVMAYHAVMPTAVARQELTSAQSKGSHPVPGFLLAKMALHNDLHGQGLGGELLLDALTRIVEASDRGGGRVIVVDAINESVVDFYRHYGFKPVKNVDQRLVMPVADARKNLGMGSGSLSISTDHRVGLMRG